MAIKYDRLNYEKEIKEFQEWNILTSDNTIDYKKYRAWFFHMLSSKCPKGSDINKFLDAINEANFIAKTAFEDSDVEIESFIKNGGAKEKEVIKYILEEASPESKKLLLDRMIKAELAKGNKQDKNSFGDDTSSTSDNDTTTNELDEKDAIATAILLFMPQFVEHINNMQMKEATEDREYFNQLLVEYGYKKEVIKDSIERLIEIKEERKEQKKKEEYNLYKDFNFLYYMHSLGVDYNITLYCDALKEPSIFERLFEEKKSEKKPVEVTNPSSIIKDLDSHTKDKEYLKIYNDFSEKYKTEISLDTIVDSLLDDSSKDNYKQVYITNLMRAYEAAGNIKNIVAFTKDYENLMREICDEERIPVYEFGCSSADEIADVLTQLRDPDINLTRQTKENLEGIFGTLDQTDASVISKHIEAEFNNLISVKDKAAIRVSVAEYKALNEIHASRSGNYSFMHPFKYNDEKNALKRMGEKLMGIADAELRGFVNELLAHGKIYKEGYENEANEIEEFRNSIHKKQRRSAEIIMPEDNDNIAILDFLSSNQVKTMNQEAAPVQKPEQPTNPYQKKN